MRKKYVFLFITLCFFVSSSNAYPGHPGPNGSGHHEGRGDHNRHHTDFRDGYWPYPTIDLTNGIPPWVNNYNNTTVTVPQNKNSYVRTYDNVSQDGKIYYQTFSQPKTEIRIVTVKKANDENPDRVKKTYESSK